MFVMNRCKHGLLKEQCSICMRENVKRSLKGAHTISSKAKQEIDYNRKWNSNPMLKPYIEKAIVNILITSRNCICTG